MWAWLEVPATRRGEESHESAERRATWVSRIVEADFVVSYVLPAVALAGVLVALAVRSVL